MNRNPSVDRGFTLIELLVVIGILGLLIAVLLPQLIGSKEQANLFADGQNQRWHFTNFEIYKQRQQMGQGFDWPKGGGHKFVLAPWVKRLVEPTAENRDRYFQPGRQAESARLSELKEDDIKKIWTRFEDLSSEDTDYAGRSDKHYRDMLSGNEAIMANDNEYGSAFKDGSINVLMGSGSVRVLAPQGELKEYWKEDDPEYFVEVGENSPVPLLRKLSK